MERLALGDVMPDMASPRFTAHPISVMQRWRSAFCSAAPLLQALNRQRPTLGRSSPSAHSSSPSWRLAKNPSPTNPGATMEIPSGLRRRLSISPPDRTLKSRSVRTRRANTTFWMIADPVVVFISTRKNWRSLFGINTTSSCSVRHQRTIGADTLPGWFEADSLITNREVTAVSPSSSGWSVPYPVIVVARPLPRNVTANLMPVPIQSDGHPAVAPLLFIRRS
mmetsp:Transcript_106667/g.309400  ORF Transcript_106667/g.309400 Transcript_106667/m.309400 type:complete len:223 (-) Transcript_106667:104-772(-)